VYYNHCAVSGYPIIWHLEIILKFGYNRYREKPDGIVAKLEGLKFEKKTNDNISNFTAVQCNGDFMLIYTKCCVETIL